jgi:choline kinase
MTQATDFSLPLATRGIAGARAIILAAGVGARLGISDAVPKSLLEFEGRSLMARHIALLSAQGVESIAVGVGYKAELITAEASRQNEAITIRTVLNPRYREGSMVTLWTMREEMTWGGDVLLMDADVLYDRRMLDRLGASSRVDSVLADSDYEEGDEPVKLCRRDGRIVEFSKIVQTSFEECGESVGFFRFSSATAAALIDIVSAYIRGGRNDEAYEEAIRDLLLGPRGENFSVVDVTGLPWIEIDFPEDVRRAEIEVLPLLTE